MANKVNSTKSVNDVTPLTDKELELQIKSLGTEFQQERLIPVSIPKGLAKNIGTEVPIGVNGVFMVIPTDGNTYEIPETFARHLQEYLGTLTT
jgi:hypothetical protein